MPLNLATNGSKIHSPSGEVRTPPQGWRRITGSKTSREISGRAHRKLRGPGTLGDPKASFFPHTPQRRGPYPTKNERQPLAERL